MHRLRFVLLLMVVVLVPSAGSAVQPTNFTEITATVNDGWAKVVRVGDKDTVDVLHMPKITAKTSCPADGFRASMVGPKAFAPTSVTRSHSWIGSTSEAPSAAAFGAVCKAGRAAAYLPVTVTGRCKRIKGIVIAGTVVKKTVKVPFAVDCHGYVPAKREALIHWWKPSTQDNFVLPLSQRSYALAKGFTRSYVIGEVWKDPMSTRRSVHGASSKTPDRMALVAHPDSIEQLKQKGWAVGTHKALGYIENIELLGQVPIHLYYHPARKDYALSARPDVTTRLSSAGYQHVRTEGYIYPLKP
jgi:hypothetical protein